MTHHQSFLKHLRSLAEADDLERVCRSYKTANDNYAFELNGRLKGGLPLEKFLPDLPHLRRVICATLAQPITLYRMTSDLEFSVPLLHALEGPFRYQAFMSTADSPRGLERFVPSAGRPLLLEIECPPGIALAPFDLFSGTEEDEYLFGCGTTFQPIGAPRLLDREEAREYVQLYSRNTLNLVQLKALKNPPYVEASNLVTL